jgi:hypothetical protein
MTKSDPDAAEPELAVLALLLLLVLWVLLQAAARAATAMLSADARRRAVLRLEFICCSTPKVGRDGDWPARGRRSLERQPGGVTDEWTVDEREPSLQ